MPHQLHAIFLIFFESFKKLEKKKKTKGLTGLGWPNHPHGAKMYLTLNIKRHPYFKWPSYLHQPQLHCCHYIYIYMSLARLMSFVSMAFTQSNSSTLTSGSSPTLFATVNHHITLKLSLELWKLFTLVFFDGLIPWRISAFWACMLMDLFLVLQSLFVHPEPLTPLIPPF
jgi:hypothetical protein